MNFKPIFYFFLVTLSFLLIACNSPAGEESENVLPTLVPTAVITNNNAQPENNNDDTEAENPIVENVQEPIEDTQEPIQEEVEDSTGSNGSSGNVTQASGPSDGIWTADARLIPFDTFVFGYRIETTLADGTVQFVALTVENSKPDNITLWTPSVQGIQDAEILQDVRLGVFEDNSFMYAPQMGCIWSNEGGTNDEMLNFNTDNFLTFANQPDAQYVGMETVNGLETFAYEVGAQTLTEDLPDGVQVVEANGRFNIYELPTGELLIVRASMEMISNYDFFNETTSINPEVVTTFNSEITNINQPIDVQIPEACEQQANDFPYPIYPDGFIQASMPELAVLQVADGNKSDIAEWYQAEMVNAGWTETSFQDLGQVIMINFQMNDQAVTISIVDDPTAAGVAITFMSN